jgi:hypothetical protein
MPKERRNVTFVGRKRRKEFERSLQGLRDIGLPGWALECYRRVARVSGQLPHEIVARVATNLAKHIVEDPQVTALLTLYNNELSRLEAAYGIGFGSAMHGARNT